MERWKEILTSRTESAKITEYSRGVMAKYLEFMHKESIKVQGKIMNKGKEDQLIW